ncbi:hypothetical protein ACFW93_06180 [Streptomyces canus]|uniref:hypothetical protein n=1 Tax=Streptomyces canus TaxID=58343 RepID=UPI0036841557
MNAVALEAAVPQDLPVLQPELASAGASVVGVLSTLAHWLGPLRAGVLGLL